MGVVSQALTAFSRLGSGLPGFSADEGVSKQVGYERQKGRHSAVHSAVGEERLYLDVHLIEDGG